MPPPTDAREHDDVARTERQPRDVHAPRERLRRIVVAQVRFRCGHAG
jgi:hypothetical protein